MKNETTLINQLKLGKVLEDVDLTLEKHKLTISEKELVLGELLRIVRIATEIDISHSVNNQLFKDKINKNSYLG